MATTFTADEPDRLRGPAVVTVPGSTSWRRSATRRPLDNLLFGLRLGDDPRLCVTTTPKPVRLVTDLVKDPTTAIARGTTYENRAHLAPSFFERIVTKYEGTRLGQQELLAELLEVSRRGVVPVVRPREACDRGGRVRPGAAGAPGDRLRGLPARGGGLVPGAPGPRARSSAPPTRGWPGSSHRPRRRRHAPDDGDRLRRLHGEGLYSEAAARAILARGQELPCRGRFDTVRLRPGELGPDRDRPDGLRRVRTGLRPAGPGPLADRTACSTAWTSSRSCSIGVAC